MSARFDWIVVGSGFGGSVSALRLAEKGYRVLVIEKGRRFSPRDFPRNNLDLKRWLWAPKLGARGIFQMTTLRHVTVLHGVGVGGGSLGYANTLPTPKRGFFAARSWAHLADWERELAPHYATARRMLGATRYPGETYGDRVLGQLAAEMGRAEHHEPTEVGVYFGKPGVPVNDPYFAGRGPKRVGCTHCGACMTGCSVGAKNTLDKNYLHLAEGLGVEILSETEVTGLRHESGGGYRVEARSTRSGEALVLRARQVVLAGGVMGTMPLLLAMRDDPSGLPKLSARLGHSVRTNNESLLGVVAPSSEHDFTRGVAITSILHTDEHSHVEPVRYGAGSTFFRALLVPHAPADQKRARLSGLLAMLARDPLLWARTAFVQRYAEKTQILLYMRTLDETLRFELGRSALTGFRRGLVSRLEPGGRAPSANLPEATAFAQRFAAKVGGLVTSPLQELFSGAPTTAHILGGACLGRDAEEGVIDTQHRVFNYPGLYVIDGSAMSANPGVNPSLTITAMAERAMSFIRAA